MLRDLAFGARLALAGGRRSIGRLALVAVSTGLGVAVLLLAASVPTMWHAKSQRAIAVQPDVDSYLDNRPARALPDDEALYIVQSETRFRDLYIGGGYLLAGGPHAPLPPGLDRLPAPGEIYLTPALAELLASDEGALLRPRFPQRVAGTIGKAGLAAPDDLAFYAGTATVSGYGATSSVQVVRRFWAQQYEDPLPPLLWLLVLVGVVALLTPVLTVIATAGRAGSLARDRRLAALRLVGAGARQTRQIAAGEALLGALAGSALGAALYLLGRTIVASIELYGGSFFASDVHPAWPVGVLVLLLGPVLAVVASVFALRGAVIEPLGVVRQGGRVRRRLGWRLVPAVVGVLILGGAKSAAAGQGRFGAVLVVLGLSLLLLGVPLLLPWLVERLIDALPRGSVSYELAVRRLRLDGAAPARLVGGVAVVLAGSIALTSVLFAAQRDADQSSGGLPRHRPAGLADASVVLDGSALAAEDELTAAVRAVPGVTVLGTVTRAVLARDRDGLDWVLIIDCGLLRRLFRDTACADGDVFVNPDVNPNAALKPGEQLLLAGAAGRPDQPWRLPATLRRLTSDSALAGPLVVTPGALRSLRPAVGSIQLSLTTGGDSDTLERLRNAAAPLTWQARVDGPPVYGFASSARAGRFHTIRNGLLAGALVVLLLAGASMVAVALEQIMERRRPLAVLAAVGVPRSMLARSVLWQNLLPIAVAVPVAVGTGLAGSRLLLSAVGTWAVATDWLTVGLLVGASLALVLAATALTLPAVRRVSRASELRTE